MTQPHPTVTLAYNPTLDRFEIADTGVPIDLPHLRSILLLLRYTCRSASESRTQPKEVLPKTKQELARDLEQMTEGIVPSRIARSTARELAKNLTLDDLDL